MAITVIESSLENSFVELVGNVVIKIYRYMANF